ncbi:glutathione S-transferase family protein [Pacificimonas sp. ICDLI1SI03]
MLTIHHLRLSQSERIVWLAEELGLDYELKVYERRSDNRLAPDEYKALSPMGVAPVITDGDLVLGESGATLEYILATHGTPDQRASFAPGPDSPDHADHLFWFHWANGTFMATAMLSLMLTIANAPEGNPAEVFSRDRNAKAWAMIEARLGEADYFGGQSLTLADINMGYALTTGRAFRQTSVEPFPNIRAWLQRIGQRDAYRAAMAKAEPGMTPMLS